VLLVFPIRFADEPRNGTKGWQKDAEMFSLKIANSNEFRETGSIEFEHRMNPFSFTSLGKTKMPGH